MQPTLKTSFPSAPVTEQSANQAKQASNLLHLAFRIETLQALLLDMTARNTAVITIITALSNGRIERNKVLYHSNTGLYDIQLEVKKYIKSVFRASFLQYKQVRKIKFTKRKP
jgi:hypothetical protein